VGGVTECERAGDWGGKGEAERVTHILWWSRATPTGSDEMAKANALFAQNLDMLRRGKPPAGQFLSDLSFDCVSTVFLLVTRGHKRCG